MVGVIIQSTGSYRPGLVALGVQSVLGALVLLKWQPLSAPTSRELREPSEISSTAR